MFYDFTEKEIQEINGGGVGGFVVGYFLGAVVGYVGTPIVYAVTKDEDTAQAFFISSPVTFGAIGSMFTGPV